MAEVQGPQKAHQDVTGTEGWNETDDEQEYHCERHLAQHERTERYARKPEREAEAVEKTRYSGGESRKVSHPRTPVGFFWEGLGGASNLSPAAEPGVEICTT